MITLSEYATKSVDTMRGDAAYELGTSEWRCAEARRFYTREATPTAASVASCIGFRIRYSVDAVCVCVCNIMCVCVDATRSTRMNPYYYNNVAVVVYQKHERQSERS